MREAAVPGYRLAKARTSTKVLIACGLFGLFIGLASAVGVTVLKTGLRPSVVADYYAGSEVEAGSIDALTESTGRPIGELAEITHLHLMGGSMLLFFLCHLLSLCEVQERTRIVLYMLAFGSFLLTFTIPWAIVFLGRGFAYAFAPCVGVLLASLLICTGVPFYEMWWRKP